MDNANKQYLLYTGFACNNNCVVCSNFGRSAGGSTQEIKNRIRDGARDGYRVIEFIGGEPTIRRDFFELLESARECGYNLIAITSNGRMFAYPDFCQQAAEAGLNKVALSLYGHTPLLHDGITRTPQSFVQCLEGLKNLQAHPEVEIAVNTVANVLNYAYLGEMADFLLANKVPNWTILELLPDGRCEGSYASYYLNLEQTRQMFASLNDYLSDFAHIKIFDFPYCVLSDKIMKSGNVRILNPLSRYDTITGVIGFESGEEPSRIDKQTVGGQVYFTDKYKVKSEHCLKCLYCDRCGGVTRQYYDRYGDKELKGLAFF